MEFDAAIATVIVVIISPKCQAGNSKVLIGSCHTLETIRPLQSVRTLLGRVHGRPTGAKNNKEDPRDTYALFRDELPAVIKEISEKIYLLARIKNVVQYARDEVYLSLESLSHRDL